MRPVRIGVGALVALATLVAFAVTAHSALAITTPMPGDPPPVCGAYYPGNCLIQSRNGTFSLSPRIVRAGGELTGTIANRCVVGYGNNDPCGVGWSAMTGLGKVTSGCRSDDIHCTVKIPRNADSGDYGVVNVGITSAQGTGYSSDYYAILGRHQSIIQGHVTNKDRVGTAGVVIDMYGASLGPAYEAVTGQDGHFAADVKAGHYRVFPSSKSVASKTEVKFTPNESDVHAPSNQTAEADFELDAGLVVSLELSHSSVPADGTQVVRAKVHVTQYGKPVSGQTVELWPQSDESSERAVTSGPRVVMCTSGGRIWPTGTLTDADGIAVNETTDQNGDYTFTLAVGTVPGRWRLTAWAKNAAGSLITADTRNSSDDQTLTVTELGKVDVQDFVPAYDMIARSSGLVTGISGDINTMVTDFIGLSHTQDTLKGLAYAPVAANQGAVLVYPAASTPYLHKDGTVTAHTSDLVLEPSNWTAVPGVPFFSIDTSLQQGRLQQLPTFAQWSSGTSVPGWTDRAGKMSVTSSAFQYFGWPYPNTTTGSCS